LRESVGLVLSRINRGAISNIRRRNPRKSKRGTQHAKLLESLEQWFLLDYRSPAPTSEVAGKMRQLLKTHPNTSFDELRKIAREAKNAEVKK
jgi:hypothetical protein